MLIFLVGSASLHGSSKCNIEIKQLYYQYKIQFPLYYASNLYSINPFFFFFFFKKKNHVIPNLYFNDIYMIWSKFYTINLHFWADAPYSSLWFCVQYSVGLGLCIWKWALSGHWPKTLILYHIFVTWHHCTKSIGLSCGSLNTRLNADLCDSISGSVLQWPW